MRRFALTGIASAVTTLGMVVLLTAPVSALSGSDFRAGNIIDDVVFTNKQSMTPTQIQQFLDSKVVGGSCDTNGTRSSTRYNSAAGRYYTHAEWGALNGNPAPFVCTTTYRENPDTKQNNLGNPGADIPGGKSAAQIIWDAAQDYTINPQVLIVLLQKEQSLITDDWPWRAQFQYATGAYCPDNGGCDPARSGFASQVREAARLFRSYMEDPWLYHIGSNNILYSPNHSCGTGVVNIENAATAALYHYTPYQPNAAALANLYGTGDGCSAYGNRNFWRMFNDWFGSTISTLLIKGSSPTIYVRSSDSSKLYAIASGEYLRNYNLDWVPVSPASDSFISSKTVTLLGNLFTRPGDGTVYLADRGKAYGIVSGTYCTRWGLPCGDTNAIMRLTDVAVQNVTFSTDPLGENMVHDNYIFIMNSGVKKPVLDASEYATSPYAAERFTFIQSPTNIWQPVTTPYISRKAFVKSLSTNAIYYHSGGTYYSFNSFDQFKTWWDGSAILPDKYSSHNLTPPSVTIPSDFLTDAGKIYLVGNGKRYELAAGTKVGLSAPAAGNLTDLLRTKTLVPIETTKAYRTPDGLISRLVDSKIRPYGSLADVFFSLTSFPSDVVAVPQPYNTAYDIDKLYLTSGRVMQLTDAGTKYVQGADGNRWQLASDYETNVTKKWIGDIYATTTSNLATSTAKTYRSIVTISGQYYAVQFNSSARPIPASVLNSQKDDLSMTLDGQVATRMEYDWKAFSFIAFNNGTIFKYDVGTNSIRPLSTFSQYTSGGGTDANTMQLPLHAIDAFTVGAPL